MRKPVLENLQKKPTKKPETHKKNQKEKNIYIFIYFYLFRMVEQNSIIKSEPVDFETSIRIKEEISDVQHENSDLNSFVELSELKTENYENSLKESEVESNDNYVGLYVPKIENCENSLEDLEELEEDPLNINSAVHEGKKVFQCNVCNSGFKHKTSLFRHIDTVHEKKKPFKCTICEAGFTIKDNLKRHIHAVHEGKKPFSCSECESTFTARSSLSAHFVSVHEGSKNFVCETCESKFATKAKLNR
jgi:uncharacterized Zn-finger protein